MIPKLKGIRRELLKGLVTLALFNPLGSGHAQNFQPGVESPLQVPNLSNPVLVYLPEDYTPERRWPTIFHYHGTNGRPTTSVPKAYTGGKGFIIVGMEFTVRGTPKATKGFFEAEAKALLDTTKLLSARAKVDTNQLYIGGFSKGGWIAGTLAEAYLPGFAGAYLLGAGKTPFQVVPPRASPKQRSLYIGVGQLELNYPYGIRAIEHFGKQKFRVTFDGYPGQGHSIPMGRNQDPFQKLSPAFLQWWRVELYRNSPEELQTSVNQWFSNRLGLVQNPNLVSRDRFLAAYRVQRAPFYRFLTKNQREAVTAEMEKLGTDPEVVAERNSQNGFFQVVSREISKLHFKHLHQTSLEYFAVYSKFPGTYHGTLAGIASDRISGQIGDRNTWRFADADSETKAGQLLEDSPLPSLPKSELLEQVRAVETVIR